MFRQKYVSLVLVVLLAIGLSGCVALLAGAAGGVGTATWLGGKLSEEVKVPFDRSIDGSKAALKSLNLEVIKFVKEDTVAQIRSKYSDGREIWIDVHKVSDTNSRIEVRVGVTGDKEAARKILDRILRYI
ncbi:MAG: DUF3568 family protein [Candidatus Omnitrophica bacterium]|nr:DUF3568 family protein [Candidatus Omnitrophota bacterium]MDD5653817.1 DUF3568 family protein [Candidatus Omnitrophota bacterium]